MGDFDSFKFKSDEHLSIVYDKLEHIDGVRLVQGNAILEAPALLFVFFNHSTRMNHAACPV